MTDPRDLALERLRQARDVYEALTNPCLTRSQIEKAMTSLERTRSSGAEMLLHLRGKKRALIAPPVVGRKSA